MTLGWQVQKINSINIGSILLLGDYLKLIILVYVIEIPISILCNSKIEQYIETTQYMRCSQDI